MRLKAVHESLKMFYDLMEVYMLGFEEEIVRPNLSSHV